MSSLDEAAERRAARMGARADRPSQRRCAEFPDSPRVALTRGAQIELREPNTDGDIAMSIFTGYASVVARGYEMYDAFGPYMETVQPGAFAKTLAQDGLDVPLVLAHDSLRRIASTANGTLTLSEDKTGLRVEAQLDPADPDVAYITPKIRSGLIREMSFAFQITRGEWSPDFSQFNILEVDINRGDVAIVGYGANPYTSASLRSVIDKVKHKRALDAPDVSVMTQALGWFAAVDSIADEAVEALGAYLGAVNLDPDEMPEPGMAALSQTIETLRKREADARAALLSAGHRPALHLSDI